VSLASIERLYRRVRMALAPGRVTATNDAGTVQKLQITLGDGQVVDAVPAVYIYGLAMRPHPGADVVFLANGGDRGDGCIVAVNDQRYRLTGLAEGEVCLHDDIGHKVYLSRSGIVIDGGGQPIVIQNTPTTTLAGDLHVSGEVIAKYGTTGSVSMTGHKHKQGDDSNGDSEDDTDAPTGGT
jgi:phage baseplate assembly protein V